MGPKTVLSVDDSRMVRITIKRALGPLGYQVLEAGDGKEALTVLGETRPDLLLLDLTMPVMSGHEVLEVLRNRGDSTPIILLTAEPTSATIEELQKRKNVQYLLKPFKPDKLIALVSSTIGPSEPGEAGPPSTGSAAGNGEKSGFKESKGAAPVVDGPGYRAVLYSDDSKLSQTLSEQLVGLRTAADGKSVVGLVKAKGVDVVLVDPHVGDASTIAGLVRKLKLLAPELAVASLGPAAEESGLSDVLPRNLRPEDLDRLLAAGAPASLVKLLDQMLAVAPHDGASVATEDYYTRMKEELKTTIAGCGLSQVILDLSLVPEDPQAILGIVTSAQEIARCQNARVLPVVPKSAQMILRTRSIRSYPSVDAARADTSA